MDKSKDLSAKIISVIFHPLLMPTYALVILFNSHTHYSVMPYEVKRLLYILVFLCTFLIPISVIPFLVNLRIVSSLGLKNQHERIIPLLVTSISYYFAFYLLNRLTISSIEFVKIMILASSVLIFICLIISIRWKISAHLIGIGGLLASLFFYAAHFVADYTYILMVISIIAGFIAYARLKLEAHDSAQVYLGFALGFVGMLVILYYGFRF